MKFQDFEINWNQKLGSGYISDVYLCTNKLTKQQFAIKIINLENISSEEMINLKREV